MFSVVGSKMRVCVLVIHVLGHTVNFYHVSTQTPGDLTCLFRNFYRSTHVLPKFHYWCWGTITGKSYPSLHKFAFTNV